MLFIHESMMYVDIVEVGISTTDIAARVRIQSLAIPFPLLFYTHALIQTHITTKWQV